MLNRQVKDMVISYFDYTQSHILSCSENELVVQLSSQADRALTNRPYYWAYIDRTNLEPTLLTYTYPFGNQAIFTNPQISDIFNDIKRQGTFIQLFETPHVGTFHSIYETWLNINVSVNYIAHLRMNELYSIGISLLTGEIQLNFLDRMDTISFQPAMPPQFSQKATFSMERAIALIEKELTTTVLSQNLDWLHDARFSYQEECEHAIRYFDTNSDESDYHKRRLSEINSQYMPRIEIEIINCGLFHFLNHFPHKK